MSESRLLSEAATLGDVDVQPRLTRLFRSWFDFGMSYATGPIGWRLPIAVQIFLALVEIVLIFAVPESPRWLYTVGRKEEAIKIMCLAYDKDEGDAVVQREKAQIEEAMALDERSNQVLWTSLFKQDTLHTRARVMLAFGAHVSSDAEFMVSVLIFYGSVHEPDGRNQLGRLLHSLCVSKLILAHESFADIDVAVLVQNVGMTPKLAQILGGW